MGTASETGAAPSGMTSSQQQAGELPQRGSRIGVCLLSDTVGLDAGTERQVLETARRLHKDRFDVHVICLEDSPQLRSLEGVCNIAVFPTASVNSWTGLVQARRFREYLQQHRIQIAHAYMNK